MAATRAANRLSTGAIPDRIALVTARAARGADRDMPVLLATLRAAGADASETDWDDARVDWSRFDLVLLRSTWDYVPRLVEFRAWVRRVAAQTRLLNPPGIVRWNTDKHYLANLARAGVPVVPGKFVEPGEDAARALDDLLADSARGPASGTAGSDIVVKPAVGAGARDARRHARVDRTAILAHIRQLLDAGRSVLVQPYLAHVDEAGETALVFFDGIFSHAIRKAPLLQRGAPASSGLFAEETITPRTAAVDELAVANRALAAIPAQAPLLYARVDLIRDDADAPRVLELELIEPSVFIDCAAGAAGRFAGAIVRRMRP